MIAAHGVIYLLGVAWLTRFVGTDRVLAVGLYPFLAGDVLKSVVAVVAVSLLRTRGRLSR